MNLWFVLTGYYDLPIQGHLRPPVLDGAKAAS
jgi:hypothetical protein